MVIYGPGIPPNSSYDFIGGNIDLAPTFLGIPFFIIFIIYYLLFIIYYLLFIIYYLLFIIYYL
jgi:hypothetical protein